MIILTMELLIDGYNLIHAMDFPDAESLQEQREALLKKLHEYQVERKVSITVVFDGSSPGGMIPDREKHGKIQVIFTSKGTSADDWIIEASRRYSGKYVVVSNDNEILNAVEAASSLTLSNAEFKAKMNAAHDPSRENPYLEDKTEDTGPLYPKVSTKKKGRSKRLPKKQRRKQSQLKNF
jgi:predicted RNA-binding protein with PIN domain